MKHAIIVPAGAEAPEGKYAEAELAEGRRVRLAEKEYTPEDFDAIYANLSDPETMQHYPAPFDAERVRGWIAWNLDNYRRYGFGLWAVVLKETGAFIGDCGVTMQQIDGETLPEIGYHIAKQHWRRGCAKEAAAAVRDWFFRHTDCNAVCACMKHTQTRRLQF